MQRAIKRMTSPLALVFVWEIVLSLIALTYYLFRVEINPYITSVWLFGFSLILSWWVRSECIARKRPFFEIEAFVFVFWPFFLPYFIFMSRGKAGVRLVLLLFGLILLAVVLEGMAVVDN